MKNLFNDRDRKGLEDRIVSIPALQKGKWGWMTSSQAVVHMADVLRVPLGDRPVPFRFSIFAMWPLNKWGSQWFPWWYGAPTAIEFIQGRKGKGSPSVDIEIGKVELLNLMERFSKLKNEHKFPKHPTFGTLTKDEWARLMWRHIDHHLRQFGL